MTSQEEGTNSFPTNAIIRNIFGLNWEGLSLHCRNHVKYVIIHQPRSWWSCGSGEMTGGGLPHPFRAQPFQTWKVKQKSVFCVWRWLQGYLNRDTCHLNTLNQMNILSHLLGNCRFEERIQTYLKGCFGLNCLLFLFCAVRFCWPYKKKNNLRKIVINCVLCLKRIKIGFFSFLF